MPVVTKNIADNYIKELRNRFANLLKKVRFRELKSGREGCLGRSSWQYPDKLRATQASASEIRLAIDDFKAILKELGKLK